MSDHMVKKTIDVPVFNVDRDWAFGSPSRTIDRFAMNVQEVYLPSTQTLPGQLSYELHDSYTSSHPERSRKSKIKNIFLFNNSVEQLGANTIGIDLRLKSPENWAHSFTNHLPLALFLREELSALQLPFTVILPSVISSKISELFKLAGFVVLQTNADVRGKICSFSSQPWISLRGCRVSIVERALQGTKLQEMIREQPIPCDNVFLSRKDRRKLINENEFEEYLADHGFKKIYLEELSLLEQISLVAKAKNIIAVHGAALGPLIMRESNETAPYKLLEIFSPAHVTNVYRTIAHQQGGEWTGVIGDVWPDLLSKKANFENNLEDFTASIDSLELAMKKIGMI